MTDPFDDTLDLVKKSQGGDEAALNSLFERYYPRVLKVIRMRMGKKLRLREDSTDMLQHTFINALKKFHDFEMHNEASFINWLSKLAEHVIGDRADLHSAQKRDPAREEPLFRRRAGGETASVEIGVQSSFVVPLDRAIRSEEEQILEEAIGTLSDAHRECIVLRNYIGLSFREIADETERPTEGAARMMHAKAMGELVEKVRGRSGRSSAD